MERVAGNGSRPGATAGWQRAQTALTAHSKGARSSEQLQPGPRLSTPQAEARLEFKLLGSGILVQHPTCRIISAPLRTALQGALGNVWGTVAPLSHGLGVTTGISWLRTRAAKLHATSLYLENCPTPNANNLTVCAFHQELGWSPSHKTVKADVLRMEGHHVRAQLRRRLVATSEQRSSRHTTSEDLILSQHFY